MVSQLALILIVTHLGVLFGVAGVVKTADPSGFATQLDQHAIVPGRAIRAVAILVPVTELLLGTWLLTGFAPREASVSAALMLTLFLAYRGLMRLRRVEASCGCFGANEGEHSSFAESIGLTLNISLALLAYVISPTTAIYSQWVSIGILVTSVSGLLFILVRGRRREVPDMFVAAPAGDIVR